MKFLKTFRRVAAVSAIALLAVSASPAKAAEGVADLGHISASVTGLLNIQETSPIRFGNFSITCPGGTCDTSSTITLDPGGTRTKVDGSNTVTLLYGLGNATGVANGTDLETGSQQPGFYDITTGGEGGAAQNVYITFADNTGQIIDNNHDNVHPNNVVTLTGPTAQTFTVNSFVFESDNSTTGYAAGTALGNDVYGYYVTTSAGGLARIRVGATLKSAITAADYAPGPYTGTFYIMASY